MTDRTVLVIDFEPTRLKATRELLLRSGFDVAAAANSNELATALRAQLPRVVLIEPMLPGHDGFAICRSLKARSSGAIPYIIIGARIFRGQRYKQMAKDAGADLFLHRPEHDQLLVEVLTQMIGASKHPSVAPARAAAGTSDPLDLDFPRPTGAVTDRGPLDDLDWDRFEQQLDNVFDDITTGAVDLPTGPASAGSSSKAVEVVAPDPQLQLESAIDSIRQVQAPAAAPAPAAAAMRVAVAQEQPRSRAKLMIAAASIAVFGVSAALYLGRDWFTETPVRTVPQPEPAVPSAQPENVVVDPTLQDADSGSNQAEVAGERPNTTTGGPGESTTSGSRAVELSAPRTRPAEAIEQRPLTLEPRQVFKPKPSSERLTDSGSPARPSGAVAEPAVATIQQPTAAPTTTAAPPEPEPIVETIEPIADEPKPETEPQSTPVLTDSSGPSEAADETPHTLLGEFPADEPMIAGVNEVTRPELIASSRIEPSYPLIAKQSRKGGSVTIQAVVKADGAVGEVKILREPDAGLGLGKAAVHAVKRWRFKPGTLKGKPIDTYLSIVVTFKP